jgi:hypothetical protein
VKPNKQQQQMLNQLEEIGELKDVIVRGAVILRLGDMRLRMSAELAPQRLAGRVLGGMRGIGVARRATQ